MDSLLSSISSTWPRQIREKLIEELLSEATNNPIRVHFPFSGYKQVKFKQLRQNSIFFENQGESSSIPLAACLGFTFRLKSKKLKIDSEISKNRLKNRKLEHWESVGPDQTLETDSNKWDQFEVNYKKFGVVTSFDEELYTTKKVAEDQLSAEQVTRAKIIEKEILSKETLDQQEGDEEELFGAVLGSGRFYSETPEKKDSAAKNEIKDLPVKEKKTKTEERNDEKINDLEDFIDKVREKKEDMGQRKAESKAISDLYFRVFEKIPRDNSYATW